MTKKISLEKKKKPSLEEAIKKYRRVKKFSELQRLKTDVVCYPDYAIPGKYRFKKE